MSCLDRLSTPRVLAASILVLGVTVAGTFGLVVKALIDVHRTELRVQAIERTLR